MQKNDHDWTFRFGEFDVGEGYTIEIGYTYNFTILYVRVWHGDDFYVGTTFHAFENMDSTGSSWPGEMIIEKIKDLPPHIYNACIKYVERIKNLQAFA